VKLLFSKKLDFLGNPIIGLLDAVWRNLDSFRFQKISDSFYRGSDASKNIPELARQGIKMILNLKTISKAELDNLTRIAKKYDIEYINIPVNPFKIQDSIPAIIAVLGKASEENPLFVHCTFGRDRTGFVTALYRNLEENWDIQDAISDMYENGFRKLFFTMDQYLRSFNKSSLDAIH
jgi:protein tyrosine phosphatase (PTP) superfamily phosphohydrolase (DUF442 family)